MYMRKKGGCVVRAWRGIRRRFRSRATDWEGGGMGGLGGGWEGKVFNRMQLFHKVLVFVVMVVVVVVVVVVMMML